MIASLLVVLWNGDPRMLDPTDVSWITEDDPFAHEAGWEQFRASPLWQYPIGASDGYGLERGSSIVYSDSVPIAALIFRPLSPLLPTPFQYLGWWAVLCVVLQGYWAIRLIQLRSAEPAHAYLGAAFFMIAPVLLNRIGWHSALASHWLILCALWLYLSSPQVQARRWALLLLLTVSVHAYLFLMIGGLWAAHLVKCRMARTLDLRALWTVFATPLAVAAWMHCLGYFIVGQGAAEGGPTSRFDLMNFVVGSWWTYLLPAIPNPATDDGWAWDGFSYLGVGLMLLLVATLVAALVQRARSAGPGAAEPAAAPKADVIWLPLVVAALAFLVFASSDKVRFAGHEIFSYSRPRLLQTVSDAFRGAGRTIWPTYYIVVLSIFWFAIRTWRPRVLSWILSGCLVVQIIDFHAGAALLRSVWVRQPGLTTKLFRDPAWNIVAERYRRLLSIPAFHGQPSHSQLAWFSASRGIGTNIGRFGRMGVERQRQGELRAIEAMIEGAYDQRTAYYFPFRKTWEIAKVTRSPRDLAVIADGHYLLLPGANPAGVDHPPSPIIPPLHTWIPFSTDGSGVPLLIHGWSWQESWGTWVNGKDAIVLLPLPRGLRSKVLVSFRWLGHAGSSTPQHVQLRLDQRQHQVTFKGELVAQEDTFEVVPTRDWIVARIRVDRPVAKEDGRVLGLGLMAIRADLK